MSRKLHSLALLFVTLLESFSPSDVIKDEREAFLCEFTALLSRSRVIYLKVITVASLGEDCVA